MRRESRPQAEAAIPEDTGRVLSTILGQPTHNGTTDTLLPEFTPEAAANVVAIVPPGHYAIPIPSKDNPAGWVCAEKTKRSNIFRTWRRLEVSRPREELIAAFAAFADLVREFGLASESEVVAAILLDPIKATATYGARFGRCGMCHRQLTDPESRTRGIGPECIRKIPALRGESR